MIILHEKYKNYQGKGIQERTSGTCSKGKPTQKKGARKKKPLSSGLRAKKNLDFDHSEAVSGPSTYSRTLRNRKNRIFALPVLGPEAAPEWPK